MGKKAWLIILGVPLVIAIGLYWLINAMFGPIPGFKLVSESPGKTYAVNVELESLVINEQNPFSWKLKFNYSRQGVPVLQNITVNAGDDSTEAWFSLRSTPKLEWLNEQVFRLADSLGQNKGSYDFVEVENKSGATLSYFGLRSMHDLYFWLDLQPNQTQLFYIDPVRLKGNSQFFSVYGRIGKDGGIKNSANFYLDDDVKASIRYRVLIMPEKIELSCAEPGIRKG